MSQQTNITKMNTTIYTVKVTRNGVVISKRMFSNLQSAVDVFIANVDNFLKDENSGIVELSKEK